MGAHGKVYRGLIESGWGVVRPVAVKVLALRDVDIGEVMRHLGRIARRAAFVRHPAFVQLFEVDRLMHAPTPFIVSELVEGESLASVMEAARERNTRVPIDFATIVALRIAEGLGAALFSDGANGTPTSLVHGDLSPRQILITSGGHVKVGDFGQHLFAAITSQVRSRARLAYTAPEVALGSPPSPRADVFALGVILHELLVGPRFGPSVSGRELMELVREGSVFSGVFAPNLPHALGGVITRATERDPQDRYPHARAMAFDLRREMLRLGLTDAPTCVRHAVVGRWERRDSEVDLEAPPLVRRSDIVPRSSGAHEALVRDEDLADLRVAGPSSVVPIVTLDEDD